MVIAHIDGASRGNPGPAAYGVVITREDGNTVAAFSKRLGVATNNVAEYRALLAALDFARQQGFARLKVRTDSELLARQLQGRYKVKSPDLKPLHEQARAMIGCFEAFSVEHVPREQNRHADRLANQALDGHGLKPGWADDADSGSLVASATYHRGALKLNLALPLADGEEVEVEIHRKGARRN